MARDCIHAMVQRADTRESRVGSWLVAEFFHYVRVNLGKR